VFFDYGMSVNHDLERAISLLACAIGYNKFEFAKFLLRMGANPNGRYTSERDTFLGAAARGKTPLQVAKRARKRDIIQVFKEREIEK
jgi:ankyrin repeat protein